MNQQELKNVLDLHRKWVLGEENGKRANLRSADLSSADLRSADLRSADLRSADLRYADLRSANLRSANLSCADLSCADLSSADLRSANLRCADLSSADLRSADLRSADLRSADLRSADLRYADLSCADLSYANLSYANLTHIKEDFFKRLALAKQESIGLYDAIIRGKIDGSAYEGECACFCGTIANIRKEKYSDMTIDLRPDSNSLTEKWFLAIREGDVPSSSSVSKITSEWLSEFISSNGLVVPQYKLISSLEKPELFEVLK